MAASRRRMTAPSDPAEGATPARPPWLRSVATPSAAGRVVDDAVDVLVEVLLVVPPPGPAEPSDGAPPASGWLRGTV